MNEIIPWFKLSPEVRNILIHEKVMGRSLDIICPGVPTKSGLCSQCAYVGNDDHLQIVPGYTTSMDWAWQVVRRMNDPHSPAYPNYQDYANFIDNLQAIVGSDLFFDLFYCDQDGDHLTPNRICIAALRALGYTIETEVTA